MRDDTDYLWKSIAAGAAGGLVAAFAMNRFQAAVSAVGEATARKERERKGLPEPEPEPKKDDATVLAANAISTALLDHELAEHEKQWAGPLVHYGFGAALGALYGACATATETPTQVGASMAYGTAVWLGADEVGVPLAGLSGPPTETPVSGHVNALASHLVYGLVTHFARKLFMRI